MKTRLTLALLSLCLLLTFASASPAQTPDGMPPALETVCDMETGAAYGLCNAYCEAMDCELANDSNPGTEPKASDIACSKVRTKFQNVAGRDVPCEISCPCTSIPEFNATLAGINSCFDYSFFGATGTLGSTATSPDIPFFPFFLEYAGAQAAGSEIVCGYVNNGTGTLKVLPITLEQFTYCSQLVHNAAVSRSVTCQQFP